MSKNEYNDTCRNSVGSEAVSEAVDRHDWSFLRRNLTNEMRIGHPFFKKQDWLLKILSILTGENDEFVWSAAKVAIQFERPHKFTELIKILEIRLSTVIENDKSASLGEMIDLVGDLKIYGSIRPYKRADVFDIIQLHGDVRIPSAIFSVTRYDSVEFSLSVLEKYVDSTSLLVRESVCSVGSFFTRGDLDNIDIHPFQDRINRIIEGGLRDEHWLVRRAATSSRFLGKSD